MNKDQFKGSWKQFKGKMQKNWGKLTDDDFQEAQGNSTILAGKIQERYGKSKDEANREVDSFIENLR